MKHGTPSQANRGPKNPGRSTGLICTDDGTGKFVCSVGGRKNAYRRFSGIGKESSKRDFSVADRPLAFV